MMSFFLNRDSIYVAPHKIARSTYGTGKRSYSINIDAINLKNNMDFDISVSSKRYTREKADEKFAEKINEIKTVLLGNNVDFYNINTKLNYKTTFDDGIKVSYKFYPLYDEESGSTIRFATDSNIEFEYYKKYQNLIDGSGNVHNENFGSYEFCTGYIEYQLQAMVNDSDTSYKSEKYVIPIKVVAKELSAEESFENSFKKEVTAIDKDSINEDTIDLPTTVNDFRIVYNDKMNLSFLLMPLLGIVVAGLLNVRDKEKIKEEIKNRKRRLELDFSQIVSKVLLYVSSGMTVRNSFIRLADIYRSELKKGDAKSSVAYDEIVVARNKLLNGYNEINAYEEMASNIGMRTYTRFLNIIIQSIKTGNKDLKSILNMEVQDALYERKQKAKKMGEEAATKLVLPLMMMLGIIMVVIMVPAFMGM